MGNKHYIDFGQNVIGTLETRDFLSEKKRFDRLVEDFCYMTNSLVINVISEESCFQSIHGGILSIDLPNFYIESDYDNCKFYSGAIITGLNNINISIYNTKSSIGLIMRNDDFSPIIGDINDGDGIFIFDGSLKSILGGVIRDLITNLEKFKIYPSNFGKVQIGPSNRDKLKFTYLEYIDLISNISKSYPHINFDNFFNFATKEYGFINLSGLIESILMAHGFSLYKIEDTYSSYDSLCEETEKQFYIGSIEKKII